MVPIHMILIIGINFWQDVTQQDNILTYILLWHIFAFTYELYWNCIYKSPSYKMFMSTTLISIFWIPSNGECIDFKMMCVFSILSGMMNVFNLEWCVCFYLSAVIFQNRKNALIFLNNVFSGGKTKFLVKDKIKKNRVF